MRLAKLLLVVLVTAEPVFAAEPPGKVLDLAHWKLTVPIASDGSQIAAEIRQPELDTFEDSSCFFVDSKLRGVVFRAACGGVTTKGSKYPRSELRELYGSGKDSTAVWSTDDSTIHTLAANLAVTHTPQRKNQVVCAQIHDAKDDLMMIRLEGRKLFIERNKSKDVPLDNDYQLGMFFDLKIEAGRGRIKAWYNGVPKMDWEQSRSGCYFKAGCYTQSNVDKGDSPDAYGEVVIRQLAVTPTAP
jgi:poly(beta-D-mannuronate) lyase